MTDKATPPTVFISYSHDSREHKQWVADLASKLRKNGVDVILDQWDLRYGDDVPKFMERAVIEADRVLLICTESYVRKSNDGVGGVGYEAMIVTGELIRDLGTAKFIPVIRQDLDKRKLPTAVSTRFYVDLSGADVFGEEFDRLLRELHQVPSSSRPPLGRNPFALAPSGDRVPPMGSSPDVVSSDSDLATPEEAYRAARVIVVAGDMLAWRRLVRKCREFAHQRLAKWWDEHGRKAPTDQQVLVAESMEGVEAFAPLIAIALAGVGSGRKDFVQQVALLEDVIHPTGWQQSGTTIRVRLPQAAGFVYQALHGAVCLHTQQLRLAIAFAREEIRMPGGQDPLPLWRIHDLIGWPDALGRDSGDTWEVLTKIYRRWQWLEEVFGGEEEYLRGLGAYYGVLNLNEYATALAEGQEQTFVPGDRGLDVPTHFAALPGSQGRGAYRLLTADPAAACDVWRSMQVDDERSKEHWTSWLAVCNYWHRRLYRSRSGEMSVIEPGLIEYLVRGATKN